MAGKDYFSDYNPDAVTAEERAQADALLNASLGNEGSHAPLGSGQLTEVTPESMGPPYDRPPPPSPEATRDNLGLVSALAISGGVGMATGGMSVPFQIGAQMLAGMGASVINSGVLPRIPGIAEEHPKPWSDVLTDAKSEGFLWGAVTAGSEGLKIGAQLARPYVGRAVNAISETPVGAFVRERLDKLAAAGGPAAASSRLIQERLGIGGQQVTLPSASGLNARYGNVLEPGAVAGQQFAIEQGTTLPLGNVVRSKFVDLLQNIAKGALTGSRIEKLTFANERVVQRQINKTLNSLPRLAPQEVGQVVGDLTRGGHSFRGAIAEGHYKVVDDALQAKYGVPHDVRLPANERLGDLGGARAQYIQNPRYPAQPPVIRQYGVDISGVVADANQVIAQYEKLGVSIPNEIRSLANSTETIIPWSEAQRRRSTLFNFTKQFDRGTTETNTVLKGRVELLSGNLTKAMENSVSKAPREVRDSLNTANRIWREEIRGDYESELAVKLANEQPFDVMQALLNTKNPDDIRAMRVLVSKGTAARAQERLGADALRNPEVGRAVQTEAIEKVQGSFLQHLVDQTSNPVVLPSGEFAKERIVDPKNLLELIDKMGRDNGGEIFKVWGVEEQIKQLRRIANFGALNKGGAGGTSGGAVFFQMAQAGALTGALSLVFSDNAREAALPTAVGFVLAPIAVNRLFTDPGIVNWLTLGQIAPPRSPLASKVILMTLGKMLQNGYISPDQEPAARDKIEAAQRHLGMSVTGSLDTEARLTAEERSQVNELLVQDAHQIVDDRVMAKDRSALDERAAAQQKLEETQTRFMEALGGGSQQ